MARKRITMNGVKAVTEPLHQKTEQKGNLTIGEFLRLHEQFMTVKRFEGLADKTLSDHRTFMRYLREWLQSDVVDYENHFVEKGVFLQYVAFMYSKSYKPCTMNLRLRTLKCYLRWL